LLQGLLVVVGGMGIVFLSLIIIVLVIMGLDRIFRVKEPAAEVEARPEALPAVDGGIVAAISVAMARLSEEGLLVAPKEASKETVAAISAGLASLPENVLAGARKAEPAMATVAAISAAIARTHPRISVMEAQVARPQITFRACRSSAWANFGRQQLMSRARERHR
jgi:sodium pump decarboxylase gamma subunit